MTPTSKGVSSEIISCDKMFAQKNDLTGECSLDETTDLPSCVIRCCSCEHSCASLTKLQRHVRSEHKDVKLKFEKKVFHHMEQFADWKARLEQSCQSLFVKYSGGKQQPDGRTAFNFFCHKSRNSEPMKKSKRPLRSVVYKKINKTCPAHIEAYVKVVKQTMKVEVVYQSVHMGHEAEPESKSLSAMKKYRRTRRSLSSPVMTKPAIISNTLSSIIIKDVTSSALAVDDGVDASPTINALPSSESSEIECTRTSVISGLQSLLTKCQSAEISLPDLVMLDSDIKAIQARLSDESVEKDVKPLLSSKDIETHQYFVAVDMSFGEKPFPGKLCFLPEQFLALQGIPHESSENMEWSVLPDDAVKPSSPCSEPKLL